MSSRFNQILNQSINISDVNGLDDELANLQGTGISQIELDNEIAARVAGDAGLQGQVDINTSNNLSQDTKINSNFLNLNAEFIRATGVEDNLQLQITSNASQITSNDTDITTLQIADLQNIKKGGQVGPVLLGTSDNTPVEILQNGNPALLIDSTTMVPFKTLQDFAGNAYAKIIDIDSKLGAYTLTTGVNAADANLQNQITANDGEILALQTEQINQQGQITSNDTDILNLQTNPEPIPYEPLQSQDPIVWDTQDKSSTVIIETDGTISANNPFPLTANAYSVNIIDTAIYNYTIRTTLKDIDSGNIHFVGLFGARVDPIPAFAFVDQGGGAALQGGVHFMINHTARNAIEYRTSNTSNTSIQDSSGAGDLEVAEDYLEFTITDSVITQVNKNGSPLVFTVANFTMTPKKYYFGYHDLNTISGSIRIQTQIISKTLRSSVNTDSLNYKLSNLQNQITSNDLTLTPQKIDIEALSPLQSISNRDTLYELKYNPETDIRLPVPQRIGQKLTFLNNQTDEQYFGLAGSDIENGTVRKIISDNQGNLYIAGSFTLVNGVAINRFVRYNTVSGTYFACDGGIDDGEVLDIVLAEDNLIILVGSFTAYNGGNAIANGGRILRYDIPTNTFNEATAGTDGTIFAIEKDPVLKHVWLVGAFINVDEGKKAILANRIVQYNYSNDSYIAVNNATTASVGLPSGTIRDIKITQDRRTVYLAGGFNLNNLQPGNNNSAKYDISTETFTSLGIFNQPTQHLELFENKLYISGEAVTQITQNNGTVKNIREVARYNYRTDEWFQIVSDNFATEDLASQISEVDVIYALPNGGILLGGFFVNKFMYLSPFGRQNIGGGFTVATGQVLSIVYDDYSQCLYLGGNMVTTNSGNSFNRVLKIPICNTIKYNFDKSSELLLGDQISLRARDLLNWI